MFVQLLFFFALVYTAGAVDIKSIITRHPVFQQCMPTLKMFDASAKLPAGIMSGNLIDIGNFDQCVAIEDDDDKSNVIKGKYCVVKLSLPFSMDGPEMRSLYEVFGNISLEFDEVKQNSSEIQDRTILLGRNPGLLLGWCVPHNCQIDKFSKILSILLRINGSKTKVSPVRDGMCQTKDDLKLQYDTNKILFITFLLATLFLIAISTLYDAYIQQNKKKPAHIILIAFSVITNGRKLLSVSNHSDQLSCLNGIRVLSMMWVLYGHKAFAYSAGVIMNLFYTFEWQRDPANMYLLNATVSVDSFFLLSGLLVAYGYCLAMDKDTKFNIVLYYVHRYLRLTPVLAVVIWFHVSILEFFGSGPFWPFTVTGLTRNCENNWWSTLIYIQNYYNPSSICIIQSWYLAIDMQLFILSPIILIPLWKWPKPTMIASAVLVLGSAASSFAVTYGYDLVENQHLHTEKYYFVTHTRYGPWLMGFMLGYYLYTLKKNRNNRIPLHPAVIAFGWIVGLGLIISSLYAGYDLQMEPDLLGQSFFNGFDRHGWSLGLCWVIYACTQGYGGSINSFLSWSPFQILGRFTYSMYLVHLSFQQAMVGASRVPTYFSDFGMLYLFWGDFMMALAISVCLTLAFESPMVTIEKVLFKKEHKLKKSALPETAEGDKQTKDT